MKVAIFPARGGSRRIRNKNVVDMVGQPMICWPLHAAIAANIFDAVFVSTDSQLVRSVVASRIPEARFLQRPAPLCEGHIGTQDVMRDALEQLAGAGLDVEYACCIYPTAVLLEPVYLTNAFHSLAAKDNDLDYVFAVARATPSPQKMLRADPSWGMTPVWSQFAGVETQNLEPRYFDAGQFYWGTGDAFRQGRELAGPRARGYLLPRYYAIDIDEQDDLRLARYVLKGHIEEISK